MPRKDYEKTKEANLKRYYAKREEVLQKQKAYVKKRYAEDPAFRVKYNIRRVTAQKHPLDGKSCIVCGSEEDLQRHHIHYGTNLEDINILCRKHHTEEHKKIKVQH